MILCGSKTLTAVLLLIVSAGITTVGGWLSAAWRAIPAAPIAISLEWPALLLVVGVLIFLWQRTERGIYELRLQENRAGFEQQRLLLKTQTDNLAAQLSDERSHCADARESNERLKLKIVSLEKDLVDLKGEIRVAKEITLHWQRQCEAAQLENAQLRATRPVSPTDER